MDEQRYIIETIISVDAGEDDLLERASSLHYLADFSTAEVLVSEAKRRGLRLLPASKFVSIPGKGVKAIIDEIEVRVGSPRFLVEERIAVPVSFAETIQAHSRAGKTVVVVLSGRSLSGAIVLSLVLEQRAVTANIPPRERRTLSGTLPKILVAASLVVMLVLIFLAW